MNFEDRSNEISITLLTRHLISHNRPCRVDRPFLGDWWRPFSPAGAHRGPDNLPWSSFARITWARRNSLYRSEYQSKGYSIRCPVQTRGYGSWSSICQWDQCMQQLRPNSRVYVFARTQKSIDIPSGIMPWIRKQRMQRLVIDVRTGIDMFQLRRALLPSKKSMLHSSVWRRCSHWRAKLPLLTRAASGLGFTVACALAEATTNVAICYITNKTSIKKWHRSKGRTEFSVCRSKHLPLPCGIDLPLCSLHYWPRIPNQYQRKPDNVKLSSIDIFKIIPKPSTRLARRYLLVVAWIGLYT